MQQTLRFAPLLVVLLLAGCGGTSTTADLQSQPTPIQPTPGSLLAPVDATPVAPRIDVARVDTVGDASPFIDPSAYAKMSAGDRADAAVAQINALNLSRPGAPRAWGKSGGTSGSVTVGPYVSVNNTTCRNFVNVVNIGGTAFTKQGTACKDGDTWSVAG